MHVQYLVVEDDASSVGNTRPLYFKGMDMSSTDYSSQTWPLAVAGAHIVDATFQSLTLVSPLSVV